MSSRLHLGLDNPNILGALLVPVVIVLVVVVVFRPVWKVRLFVGPSLCIATVLLALTQSRAAVVCLALALSVCAIQLKERRLGLAVVSGIVLAVSLCYGTGDRFVALPDSPGSVLNRFMLWQGAIELLLDNPGGMRSDFRLVHDCWYSTPGLGHSYLSPINTFLVLWNDFGPIAAAAVHGVPVVAGFVGLLRKDLRHCPLFIVALTSLGTLLLGAQMTNFARSQAVVTACLLCTLVLITVVTRDYRGFRARFCFVGALAFVGLAGWIAAASAGLGNAISIVAAPDGGRLFRLDRFESSDCVAVIGDGRVPVVTWARSLRSFHQDRKFGMVYRINRRHLVDEAVELEPLVNPMVNGYLFVGSLAKVELANARAVKILVTYDIPLRSHDVSLLESWLDGCHERKLYILSSMRDGGLFEVLENLAVSSLESRFPRRVFRSRLSNETA